MTKAKLKAMDFMGSFLAFAALAAAALAANTICFYIIHEPKAPAALEELKIK